MSLDLAKPPKGKKYVYECPFTEKTFDLDDEKLIGLGNPPRSPEQPVGTGSTPMKIRLISTKSN